MTDNTDHARRRNPATAVRRSEHGGMRPVSGCRGMAVSILRDLFLWRPRRRPLPAVDPDLPLLSPLERVAEVVRYQSLRLESTLSPAGVLREWFKFVLRVFLLITPPAVLLAPPITFLLHAAAGWSDYLRQTAVNILVAAAAAAAAVVIVKLLAALLRRPRPNIIIHNNMENMRHHGGKQYENYHQRR